MIDRTIHQNFISVDATEELEQGIARLSGLGRQIHTAKRRETAAETQREKNALMMEMFQLTARAKITAVQQYIANLLTSDGTVKFLVFAHHLVMLDAIEKSVRQNGIEFIRIDGSTNASVRQALVDRFQSRPRCRVGILSMTAGSLGLTLHAATRVIFAELFWTPAYDETALFALNRPHLPTHSLSLSLSLSHMNSVLIQAEDRAHRFGQKSDVSIYYLLAKQTLDDALWYDGEICSLVLRSVHRSVWFLTASEYVVGR
mgnify:CR=1 FL=1